MEIISHFLLFSKCMTNNATYMYKCKNFLIAFYRLEGSAMSQPQTCLFINS